VSECYQVMFEYSVRLSKGRIGGFHNGGILLPSAAIFLDVNDPSNTSVNPKLSSKSRHDYWITDEHGHIVGLIHCMLKSGITYFNHNTTPSNLILRAFKNI